jgi:Holliday junction resolvase
MSRNKGASGERELARALARLLGIEARRGCQYRGGPGSPDVATDIPEVHIECKRTERLRLYEALEQAITDAGEKVPVVAHRQNHQPWVAIVRLEDLPRLATQIYLTLAENA